MTDQPTQTTLMTHDDVRNFNPPADCLKRQKYLSYRCRWWDCKAAALTYANMATVLLLGKTASKLEEVYDEIEANGGAEPAMLPMNLESTAILRCSSWRFCRTRSWSYWWYLYYRGHVCVLTRLMYDPIIFGASDEGQLNVTFMLTQALFPYWW